MKRKTNSCIICGEPCHIKYCRECAKKKNLEYAKAYQQKYRKRKKPKWEGCNEDCEHCPYPDCFKPVAEMKATREVINLQEKRDEFIKTQGKMYSVTLGKYNTHYPNSNRKAWW